MLYKLFIDLDFNLFDSEKTFARKRDESNRIARDGIIQKVSILNSETHVTYF